MLTDSPLARIPLIFDLGVTLLLFALSAGAGFRLLRWLRISVPDALERGLFAITLGLGALSYVPFALFAVGLGRPPVLAITTLLLFVVSLPDTWRVLRAALRTIRLSANEAPYWAGLLFLALLPLLALTLLGALCPPGDPDGLHYHLTAPLRYLAEGRFVYMPTFLHVHWPIGVEMLFGIGMSFQKYYAACMVQYGMGILLLFATYALGKRIAGPIVGWLAACLLFPFIRGEMNWAYNDLGLTLYTLMAVYAFYLGWLEIRVPENEGKGKREKGKEDESPTPNTQHPIPEYPNTRTPEYPNTEFPTPAFWRLAAICAGLAATAKLPGLLTIGLIAGMAFVTLWRREETGEAKERFRAALSPALILGGIGFLVVAPWLIRCWVLTGAPVYPYFGGLFGARDWSPEWGQRVATYFQVSNTFRGHRLTPTQVFQVRAGVCLLLAVFGAALCAWRGTRAVRPLVALLFLLLFVQVATSGIYYRFLVPMVPLTLVLALWTVRTPLAKSEVLRWIAAVLVSLVMWGFHRLPKYIDEELALLEKTLPVVLGSTSRDEYLTKYILFYPTIRWCNANLPPDSVVVLGVQDAHAALFNCRTLATNFILQGAIRFDTYEHLIADLKRLGATHLIVQEGPQLYFGEPDTEALTRDHEEFPKLQRVCAEYGKSLVSEQGYTLYALNLP
jgi:hypothetical protein